MGTREERGGCPARGKEAGKLSQRSRRLSWVSKAKEAFLSGKGGRVLPTQRPLCAQAWRPAEKEHTGCPRPRLEKLAQAGRGSTQKSPMSCELGGSWRRQESVSRRLT